MRALAFAAALLAVSLARAAGADLERIKRLLDDGAYERAYLAADADSAASAGDPAFDYLYGLAALESKRANRAVYALERVLLAQPDHDAARVALARAYANVGQLDLAHALLNTVLAGSADPVVRDAANAARAQLPPPKRRDDMRGSAALEVSLGYDSNVNATTDLEQLPQPPATVLVLDSGARAKDDTFLRLDFDARVERDIQPEAMLFAAVEGYHLANFHEGEFDNTLLSVTGGGSYRTGRHRALGYASYQRLWLDGAGYLAIVQPGIAWHYAVGARGLFELGASYGDHRYDTFDIRDTEALVVSTGWRYTFATAGRPQVRVLAYLGDEVAKDDRYDYFGRDYLGLQLRAAFAVAERHQPYLHLRWQKSEYDGLDPVYGTVRDDRYWRLGLGWRYRYAPRRYVGFETEYTENDSTIVLYDFDRTRVFATTRLEWP